jgi:hypothetical protein
MIVSFYLRKRTLTRKNSGEKPGPYVFRVVEKEANSLQMKAMASFESFEMPD